jgi:23S rRNA G2069 N7-methylase RlmK/C1962 C5-methylase RlmI
MICMEIRKLAYTIYDYFKDGSNSRKIQVLSDGKIRNFKKHLEIRWTTLGPACEIIAENWSLLKINSNTWATKTRKAWKKFEKWLKRTRCIFCKKRTHVALDQVFVDLYQKLLIKISKSEYVNRIIEQQ